MSSGSIPDETPSPTSEILRSFNVSKDGKEATCRFCEETLTGKKKKGIRDFKRHFAKCKNRGSTTNEVGDSASPALVTNKSHKRPSKRARMNTDDETSKDGLKLSTNTPLRALKLGFTPDKARGISLGRPHKHYRKNSDVLLLDEDVNPFVPKGNELVIADAVDSYPRNMGEVVIPSEQVAAAIPIIASVTREKENELERTLFGLQSGYYLLSQLSTQIFALLDYKDVVCLRRYLWLQYDEANEMILCSESFSNEFDKIIKDGPVGSIAPFGDAIPEPFPDTLSVLIFNKEKPHIGFQRFCDNGINGPWCWMSGLNLEREVNPYDEKGEVVLKIVRQLVNVMHILKVYETRFVVIDDLLEWFHLDTGTEGKLADLVIDCLKSSITVDKLWPNVAGLKPMPAVWAAKKADFNKKYVCQIKCVADFVLKHKCMPD